MAGMKEFANLFYREGALEPKTAQLVAMAAMAAAAIVRLMSCPYGVCVTGAVAPATSL